MTDSSRLPTTAELEILSVLWDRGPSTVRDVQDALNTRKAIGYTTALKLLQIMFEKGLVIRDDSERTHVYAAALEREPMQSALVQDLAERAFGGSASALVLGALSGKSASPSRIAERLMLAPG